MDSLSSTDANQLLDEPSGDGKNKSLKFSWLHVAQKLHAN